MNQLISDQDRTVYLQILADLNEGHANIFTLEELSNHLPVSVRKLSDFKKGNVIDFWLLTQYAGIIGRDISFKLVPL